MPKVHERPDKVCSNSDNYSPSLEDLKLLFEGINLETKKYFSKSIINLCKADLSGLNLTEFNLEKANLMKANLTDANLQGVNLTGVYLGDAILHGTNLANANLTNANLERAELHDAILENATMDGAYMIEADLSRANLIQVNLNNAKLQKSILSGANLEKAILTNATLFKSKLNEANLKNADFTGADLRLVKFRSVLIIPIDPFSNKKKEIDTIASGGVELEGTKFVNANLFEADFESLTLKSTDLRKSKLNNSNLKNVTLINANIEGAVLNEAKLVGANLTNVNMKSTDFTKADLSEITVVESILHKSKFINASLRNANLMYNDFSEAVFDGANLSGANFEGANLKQAILNDVNLNGASLLISDLSGSFFEPNNVDDLIFLGANGLSQIKFTNPARVVDLRKKSQELGLRNEEKALISAFRKYQLSRSSLSSRLFEDLLLGGKLTDYGAKPWRSLLLLASLIIPFAVIYMFALLTENSRVGIWVVKSPDRILVREEPEKLYYRLSTKYFLSVHTIQMIYIRVFFISFYFSVLSAFSIGWRELNVGNWITRLQSSEYTLRATGWARTVSGLQSLLSVYLLALWVLTYFGKPFGG